MAAQDDAAPSVRFARPSDPPQAFIEDRRGKAPRTDEDYAALAVSYLAAGGSRRIAGDWSERFGRSAQRWRMDIRVAKRFIEKAPDGSLMLSEDGERLAYGDRPDAAVESALIAAHGWLRLVFSDDPDDAEERAEHLSAVQRHALKLGRPVREVLSELVGRKDAILSAAESYFYPPPTPHKGADEVAAQPLPLPIHSQTKPKESWDQE